MYLVCGILDPLGIEFGAISDLNRPCSWIETWVLRFQYAVFGKEVKASCITGRNKDAKRPSVKILLNMFRWCNWYVKDSPPPPSALHKKYHPEAFIVFLSHCHKKMRSPYFAKFSDPPLKHHLVSLRLFRTSQGKAYSTNKGKKWGRIRRINEFMLKAFGNEVLVQDCFEVRPIKNKNK